MRSTQSVSYHPTMTDTKVTGIPHSTYMNQFANYILEDIWVSELPVVHLLEKLFEHTDFNTHLTRAQVIKYCTERNTLLVCHAMCPAYPILAHHLEYELMIYAVRHVIPDGQGLHFLHIS